jgi:hypothetical protein
MFRACGFYTTDAHRNALPRAKLRQHVLCRHKHMCINKSFPYVTVAYIAHTTDVTVCACVRQIQMACFHNMEVSSENRGAHWCTSSGWVKSHAPPTRVVAVRMKRKGHPSDVLYMSCTSQLRWIDVSAWLWYELSKIQNTDQNLKPLFGFQKWTQN